MSNLRVAKLIAHNINASWPKPTKYLGGGVNGRVYETNNGRLMKFIYDYAPQEYEALQKLQGTFIVPRFKRGNGIVLNITPKQANDIRKAMFPRSKYLSSEMTVFVMGRVGNASSTTLRNYVRKYPSANKKNIARRVAYLIKEMHMRGVSHGNFHDENIIVSTDSAGRITGMWAIDFGRSRSIPLGKTETKMYKGETPNSRHPTKSLYGSVKNVPVYNGSRSNIEMMSAITEMKMKPSRMKRIAKLRSEVANEMKQYRSPSSRGATGRSLSPRKSPRKSPSRSATRPRSAPARIATPQKGLRVRLTLKRKRA